MITRTAATPVIAPRHALRLAIARTLAASMWATGVGLAVPGTSAAAPAPTTLPTPCAPSLCGPGPTAWLTSGQATLTATGGNKLTVNQTSGSTTLNWANFNLGAAASVIFKQPSTSSVALNRIWDSSPSQIFGAVSSNGQIYLVNQNGMVFGSTAKINVGGLLASSLTISDTAFANGLLNPQLLLGGAPTLGSAGTRLNVTDNAGNIVLGADGQPLPVQIVVQPGATFKTNGANQRLLLAAPLIDNAGSLSAPDGQVIAAAGQEVYLAASTDPNLRGLIVAVNGGGTVTNEVAGTISADRGNVTLLGLAVNQLGRASASTSITVNGSVYLLAQDSPVITYDGSRFTFTPQEGGTVKLGAGSVTTVTADQSGGTTVDSVVQPISAIDVAGKYVTLEGGSQVIAHGGDVSITTRVSNQQPPPTGEDSRIRIDSGALIDVSGNDVSVPVTRNLLEVQLRGTELADDPVQRNGALYQQTVYIDARTGTPIANVSGEVALTERDVLERTSTGGTVALDSGGDVIVAQGSKINVSGGVVNYTPGYIQTTRLVTATGQVVDIGSANPNVTYVGVINPTVQTTSDRWGVVTVSPGNNLGKLDPGYVQGAAAGTVDVLAPNMVLQGTLIGQSVSGPYQRQPGNGSTPATSLVPGGQLIIGASPSGSTGTTDLRAPQQIEIVDTPAPVVVGDNSPFPGPQTLQVSLPNLISGGFSRFVITGNESVTLEAGTPLTLPVAGSLQLAAPRVALDSSVTAPSGTVSLQSVQSVFYPNIPLADAGVFVGDGVALDVRGEWTNDAMQYTSALPSSPVALNGGHLTLAANGGTLQLGNDSALEASGGGWLNAARKLTPGAGGSISLSEGAYGGVTFGRDIAIDAYAMQGATGGSFSLSAPRIELGTYGAGWTMAQSIVSDPTSAGTLRLNPALFDRYGFSRISLTADGVPLRTDPTQTSLLVDPGTVIQMMQSGYPVSSSIYSAPSASDLAAFSAPVALPTYLNHPQTISLIAEPSAAIGTYGDLGGITVGAGASINAGVDGSLALRTTQNLTVDGLLRAQGGTITLAIDPPTSVVFDAGYVAAQGVDLQSGAQLDVSGTAVYKPNSLGTLAGTLYGGGTVNVLLARGAIEAAAGSSIDFAGSQAAFDLTIPGSNAAPVRQTVASAAGALNLSAPEEISLLSTLDGKAGTGTTGPAAGGSLSVTLSRSDLFTPGAFASSFPSTPRTIELMPGAPATVQQPGAGIAVLDPGKIEASGIASLTLSADQVQIDNGVALALGEQVVLRTPVVVMNGASSASITAPFVSLGSGNTPLVQGNPTPGSATLTVTGSEALELAGNFATQGVNALNLTSGGSIALKGYYGATPAAGTLAVDGNITLTAASIVPQTQTSYTISALNPLYSPTQAAPGVVPYDVRFAGNGHAAGPAISVNGALTVNADTIEQGTSLLAPFGSITLNGTDSVTLAPGSVTSVSGKGATLPYGIVEAGTQWVYGYTETSATTLAGIPNREVQISGPTVTVAHGATIDVSGGGDLLGYQWIPGPGGTRDALAAGVIPGLYVILPSLRGQYAPFDPLSYAGSTLQPGASVYLAGGAGVAAGYYPLLPARYALMPGAILVQEVSGYANLPAGATATATNGAPVVSGYFTFGNTGLGGAQTQGFAIEPGSYAHTLADYVEFSASSFFAQQAAHNFQPTPVLPADAGEVSFSAQQLNAAANTIASAPATGGIGATIAISGTNVEVESANSPATPAGTLGIAASTLDSWSAGRLLIGGNYSAPGTVNVTASSVTIDSGVTLTENEVVVVANQGITVGPGATVQSTSAAQSAAFANPALATPTVLNVAGGAAVLAVSDLSAYVPTRTSAATGPLATVTLAAGSEVSSKGAVTVDAPGGASLASGALTGSGAAWSIGGAQSLVLGSTGGAGSIVVNSALQAQLAAASSVRLSSTGEIDVTGPVALGGTSGSHLGNITLDTPGLVNEVSGSSAQFAATTITLGTSSTNTVAPTAGTGTLAFSAQSITVGPGVIASSGFDHTTLTATRTVTGVGVGGLSAGGDVTIQAGTVTAASGANTVIDAGPGALLVAGGGTPVARGTLSPGGTLALNGNSVEIDGEVVAPAGQVTVSSATTLVLGATSVIDAAGYTPQTAVTVPSASPGRIVLASAGDLTQNAGSRLTVAGVTGTGGGVLSVTSGGQATLGGTLDGAAGSGGAAGGEFALAAQTIANFGALTQAVAAGGFTGAQSYVARSGDLTLAAGETIAAREVTLEADQGAVTVAGTINASGARTRGSITLAAQTALTVTATGVLDADTLAPAAGEGATRGGTITLSSVTGNVTLDTASQVSATGAAGGGELIVRAAATAGDMNIVTLPGNLSRVDQVVLEPDQPFTLGNNPTAGDFAGISSQVSAYMASAPATIEQRLGVGNASNVTVAPFVDVTVDGDVTLGSLNLASWRYSAPGAAPFVAQDAPEGVLSIRATGNVTVAGTISDGYATPPPPRRGHPASTNVDLLSGPSFAISLVAGADLASASTTGTVAGAAADLTLASGAIVRTGTGSLGLTAAEDVVFQGGATAYSGGTPGATTVNTGTSGRPANLFMTFPTNGGDVSVNAGRDVISAPVTAPVSDWQSRVQLGTTAASWGISPYYFDWTLGALGGGDVNVSAGRDVLNLAAAVADSRYAGAAAPAQQFGGGNLAVTAGRDLSSGYFYVANGLGNLTAYGQMGSSRLGTTGDPVGMVLVSGATTWNVNAIGGILLAADVQASALSVNTTKLPNLQYYRELSTDSLTLSSAGGDVSVIGTPDALEAVLGVPTADQSDASAIEAMPPNLQLLSYGGSVTVGNGLLMYPSSNGQLTVYASKDVIGSNAQIQLSDAPDSALPTADQPRINGAVAGGNSQASLQTARHTGDTTPVLIYAGRDINALNLNSPKAVNIYAGRDMADLELAVENVNATDTSVVTVGRNFSESVGSANNGIQVAGGGSFDLIAGGTIDFGYARGITSVGALTNPQLSTTIGANLTVLAGLGAPLGVAKPGASNPNDFVSNVIEASLDPATGLPLYQTDLIDYVAQVLAVPPKSLTLQQAANDFRGLTTVQQLPLLTQVLFAELVRSGVEYNNLPVPTGTAGATGPELGSALNQSNLQKLVSYLIDPSPVYQQALIQYVADATGKPAASNYQTALTEFENFPPALQVAFRYVRGYTAIDDLFPGTDGFAPLVNYVVSSDPAIVALNAAAGSGAKPFPGVTDLPVSPYSGDFAMTLGRIYTLQGGDVNILVPGGAIDVGLANTPPEVSQLGIVRSGADLGIVTEQSGNVNVFSNGDVLVNQSRVFTLGGGNIDIWSSAGSIDAGRGAKTAIAAPPPVVTVNAAGDVSINFSAAVAGSGIRTIQTNPDQPEGNVDLTAPTGTVNAGDAGIGSSGNLNIAAASVAGLNNIQVGGTSTGVPPTTSGIGVAVAAAAATASSSSASSTATVAGAADSKEKSAPLAQAALSWLDVFVVGLGDEACKPDDLECLKRQPKH